MPLLRCLLSYSFIILLNACCLPSIHAQTTIENWTPESMVSLPVIGSPAISPDGSMVAYTVRETQMDDEESEFLTHI